MFRRRSLNCIVAFAFILIGAGIWIFRGFERERAPRLILPPQSVFRPWPAAFQERIKTCYAALRSHPGDSATLTELSRLFLANGFTAQAEEILRSLYQSQPNDARVPHYLAGLFAGEGRLEEAVTYWKQAIANDPSYLPARLKLADGLRKLNHPEQAAAVYTEVLQIAPDNVYALFGLAVLDVEANKWMEAENPLKDAISHDPSFWSAFSLLATVADHLEDPALAKRARARAVQIGRFKDVPDPWTDSLADDCYDVYRLQVIGSTRATTGDLVGAVPPLKRSVELAPQNAKARRELGKTYLLMNDTSHAQEELERAIALDPSDPISYLELEKVYKAKNDIAGAEALLSKGLAQLEDSPALHFEEGLVLLAQGRAAEALAHMERARDLAPENVSTYEKMAIILLKLGRSVEAISNIDFGLRLDPKDGPLWMLSGRVHILKGEATEAEKSLNQARQLGAPDANIEEFSQKFVRQFGRRPNLQ